MSRKNPAARPKLPQTCECGGKLEHSFGPGDYIATVCLKCTPVQHLDYALIAENGQQRKATRRRKNSAAVALGRKGGKVKSEAKRAASRETLKLARAAKERKRVQVSS